MIEDTMILRVNMLDPSQIAALASIEIPSTEHMDLDERYEGAKVMISNLCRLATKDGCIAAGWALQIFRAVAEEMEESRDAIGEILKPVTITNPDPRFWIANFTDAIGNECTLQQTNTRDTIWLGIEGEEKMHLTQSQVKALLPALKHFAETGELA